MARQGVALPLTLLLGVVAVVLGFIGYDELDPQADVGDTAYRAIQLFTLEYSGPTNPGWELGAARWIAGLTVWLALISVLAAVTRKQLSRTMVRFFEKDHVVIVGLGERGKTVAAALQRDGMKAVAIESDAAAQKRDPGAGRLPIIDGDPRDESAYVDAAAQRAAHVFIAPGDDSANLQALEACLAATGDKGPTLHVAVDGSLLWRELHRSSLAYADGRNIEFISFPDRVGARLVAEAAPHLGEGPLLVWGAGPKAVRTTVHAVRRTLLDSGKPELVLAGPRSAELREEIAESEAWIMDCCSAVRQEDDPTGSGYGVAFVVGLPHADVLAGASILAGGLEGVAIVAEVLTKKGIQALRHSGFPTDLVKLVDAEEEVIGAGLFEGATGELIARAKHEDYVDKDRQRGVTPSENPSLVPWEELSEPLRQSNRRWAESVGAKLENLNAELEPLSGPVPDRSDLFDDEDLIRELAEAEHDRWVRDLEADGWTVTDGEKDDTRKLHPLLVPWDELDGGERQKDEDAIRVLPEALARIGYEIRQNGSDPAALTRGAGAA